MSGTGIRASRSIAPSYGSAGGLPTYAMPWRQRDWRKHLRKKRVSSLTHTFRRQRWNGYWIMFPGRGRKPRMATFCSARLRHGWSGNWQKAQSTSRTIPMPRGQCCLTSIRLRGMTKSSQSWASQSVCFPKRSRQAAFMGRQTHPISAAQSPLQGRQGTSRRRCSGRPVSRQARQKIHTVPGASCLWTPGKSLSFPRTGLWPQLRGGLTER